jgi:hypothetical protein
LLGFLYRPHYSFRLYSLGLRQNTQAKVKMFWGIKGRGDKFPGVDPKDGLLC